MGDAKIPAMKCIALTSIILIAFAVPAVCGDKVTFHVTSVSQSDATDYCTECNATRFTVEGFTQDKDGGVNYVLECVEVIASDPNHKSVACFRVHAHMDYRVGIFRDSVSFGSSQSYPVVIDYSIKSEKEVRKK
jgi:hypothetical protein